MTKRAVFGQIWEFLKYRKKYWLAPIIFLMVLIGFLLVVAHRESGEFFRYDQQVNMTLLPATRERLTRLWFPITPDFALKSGGCRMPAGKLMSFFCGS